MAIEFVTVPKGALSAPLDDWVSMPDGSYEDKQYLINFSAAEITKLKQMVELVDLEPVEEKKVIDYVLVELNGYPILATDYPVADINIQQMILNDWQPFGAPFVQVEPPPNQQAVLVGDVSNTPVPTYAITKIFQAFVKYG